MSQVVAANRVAPPDHAQTVVLPSAARSVPQARQLVANDLAATDVPSPVIDNALTVVTELVTNAVLHARPLHVDEARDGVVLHWSVLGADVLIDVTDGGGPVRPHLRPPSTTSDSGRGLSIVNALAREWEIQIEPDQVTVRAVVGPRAARH